MVQEKTTNFLQWSANSWKNKPVLQNILYKDTETLNAKIQILKNKPPLINYNSIINSKILLSKIEENNGFILQGGDCAESLKNKQDAIEYADKMANFILNLSAKLENKTTKKIISFARMAGQMAKPRSLKGDNTDSALYRGDLINSFENCGKDNFANPTKLIKAYNYSKILINYIEQQNYNLLLCHEAFLLPYEASLVREIDNQYYSTSAHMLWIGERTRKIDYAHIEFCKGIINPIAIKIGSNITTEEILNLCEILNPNNELGKLSFIIRMGVNSIEHKLPPLIEAIKKAKKKVLWLCDPMHGNNRIYECYKTRFLNAVEGETRSFFEIHQKMNSYAAGIHLELTYENVTECIDNENQININWQNYKTLCDARLNAIQADNFITFLSKLI